MLHEHSVTPGDIVSVKLVNGEELIGKLTAQSATTFSLSRPVLLAVELTASGVSVGFAPFMISIDDRSTISFATKTALVAPTATSAQLRSRYLAATTGLQVPAAPSGLVGV